MNALAEVVFYILIALASIVFAAEAEAGPELWAPNDNNGHIYLTEDPCELPTVEGIREKFAKKGETLYYAYGLDNENTLEQEEREACYMVPKIDYELAQAESPAGAVIVPVVNLFAEIRGIIAVFPHPMTEFSPVPETEEAANEQRAAQAKASAKSETGI